MQLSLANRNFSRERIVFGLAAVLFVVASVGLPGFFSADNLVAIVRSVSVLGILAVGMGIVIIGRGIDLSMVAIMAMTVAWYLQMLNNGVGDGYALALALGGVIAIGLINGFLIAYADVPAIFATLASSAFVFGFARSQLIGRTRRRCRRVIGSSMSAVSVSPTFRWRCSFSPAPPSWRSCFCATPNGAATSI